MVNTPNYDLDIDSTLGGNNASDYVIPSQKAIKSYVDNHSGGGTATDVQINGTSITANNVANIKTNGTYNASSNKIATMSDISGKANDNAVVHLSGNETITDVKKFASGGTSYAVSPQNSAMGTISANSTYGFQVTASSNTNLALGGKDLTYYSTDNNTNYTLLTGSTGYIPSARINEVKEQRASGGLKFWTGTKAQYDAITTKDSNTLYNITDDQDITLTLLQTIYPVGSVYLSTNSTCPLASLFGTWTLVSSGKALWTGTGSNGGSTIDAGLPNITGTMELDYRNASSFTGAFSLGSSTSTGFSNDSSGSMINFSAQSSNPIYGNSNTVQPPAYVVNVWRRTA